MLLLFLLLLCPLAFGQKVVAARAGMLYYAEGSVQVDGRNIRSVGAGRLPQVQDGQVIASPRGHAELLLGPNAVLWTGTLAKVRFDDSSVESATVTVLEGSVIVELSRTLATSRVHVRSGRLDVDLTREGLYRFDAVAESVRVYSGELLLPGAIRVARGEERSGGTTKVFDRREPDEFFYWSAYRSFMLEVDAGSYKKWGGSGWGEHHHAGFDVKFPNAQGAARIKYLTSSEAGLVYVLDGSAVMSTQTRTSSVRLPAVLGRDNFLRTEAGRAEVFLGVGVIARLGDHTRLRMIETRATSPVVAVDEGSVVIEVADSVAGTPQIRVGDSMTAILKAGLYHFDARVGMLRVFGGEASTTLAGTVVRGREGQQVNLQQPAPMIKFDSKVRDALYRWSAERSFALFTTSAAFMTQWDETAQRGVFKHKQFGPRTDTRRVRLRPKGSF